VGISGCAPGIPYLLLPPNNENAGGGLSFSSSGSFLFPFLLSRPLLPQPASGPRGQETNKTVPICDYLRLSQVTGNCMQPEMSCCISLPVHPLTSFPALPLGNDGADDRPSHEVPDLSLLHACKSQQLIRQGTDRNANICDYLRL